MLVLRCNEILQVELMNFHLCSVAFVTDVNDLLVIMVRRDGTTPGVAREQNEQSSLRNKISCHVLQASNVCVRCYHRSCFHLLFSRLGLWHWQLGKPSM